MFTFLDRIAQKWLHWRVDRAVRKDRAHADLFVKSMEARDRGVSFVLDCPTLATMFDEAARMMEEAGSVNFLEFKGVSREQMPPKIIRVTFQFDDGLSLAEMVCRLKAEKVALEQKLAAVTTE
jgi:hypothetical protein